MYKQQQKLNNSFQEGCRAISAAFYLWFWLLPHQVDEPAPAAGPTPAAPSKPATRDALMLEGDIDDDLQKALALSMQVSTAWLQKQHSCQDTTVSWDGVTLALQ